VRRRRLRFFDGAVVNAEGRGRDDRRYVPLMVWSRRARCDDIGSMKPDTALRPGNTQSIRERVAVVRADDAEDAGERKKARGRGETDHGWPSGGIKPGFSTTIEP